jgi:transcriptional regulator with XRE-family HTH domain
MVNGFNSMISQRSLKVKSYLGSYIKGERLKQKLNTAQLAQKIGYCNINKGMRRILALEREGTASYALLEQVVDVLNLDADYIESLIRQDREAYEADYQMWLTEPVKMTYTIRAMPAIYLSYDLPAEITGEEEAIGYAKSLASRMKCMVWLLLSREENIQIGADGELISRYKVTRDFMNLPFSAIR